MPLKLSIRELLRLAKSWSRDVASRRHKNRHIWQYPAGFHFSAENLEKVQNTLRRFYDYPKAVELRHESWNENSVEIESLLLENRASGVLIDEPKFATSIRQEPKAIGDIFYFRAHGRNAKAWWNLKEPWERYDYLYSRAEIKQHAERIKTAASSSGVKEVFAFYNNHARSNAAANAIMLSQKLGVRLKAMPQEEMLQKFPDVVWELESSLPFQHEGASKAVSSIRRFS